MSFGKEKFFSKIWSFIIILVLMLGSFGAGVQLQKTGAINTTSINTQQVNAVAKENLTDKSVDFNLYWEVWNKLKQKYVDQNKISEKEMFNGSLKGLAASFGDPYTIFMDEKTTKEFNDDMAGTFEGIGAEIAIRDDILTVVAPLDDSPAARAGLRSGDKILSINGESTQNISVEGAVKKIKGQKGTEVILKVLGLKDKESRELKIIRDVIVVKSVKKEMRQDGVYVIRISAFNNDTTDLFHEAIRDILVKNPKGIILDLRSDPGGYLETAIQVASEWIKEGTVVTEKTGSKQKEYYTNGKSRLSGFKTIVLVNGGSASASEIVAGALQDYGVATIVGEKTFGKGSVQVLENLSGGASLKVTIAKWLTPKGRSINEEGIKPDQEVKMTLEDFQKDKDPQLDKAVSIILGNAENNVKNLEKKVKEEEKK
ncbi:MAG: S41 family peptidase [Planctomycetes bacterium]|jgi:carboxyl-terminal processing protease|nr:S41 family peptidase [Planctomycetota bacterium]